MLTHQWLNGLLEIVERKIFTGHGEDQGRADYTKTAGFENATLPAIQ